VSDKPAGSPATDNREGLGRHSGPTNWLSAGDVVGKVGVNNLCETASDKSHSKIDYALLT
jgi:hypothetical protein